MKRIKNPNRTTMRQERQERLEFLSLLMSEADLLRQINFERKLISTVGKTHSMLSSTITLFSMTKSSFFQVLLH
jgi:hypothetical protein